MQTRKFGILSLVLGAAVFGVACETKTVVEPPPVVVSLTIAPKPVPTLAPGATFQLVAVVTGSANQAASWTASTAACAAVNATTGLVTVPSTATNGCTSVITAVSAADANARDAVSISVATTGGPPPGPVGQPSISIGSVTQFGTFFPVNPGAVFGTVDVTMNVDIPAGVTASAVRVTLNGVEVCRQAFATGGSADAEIDAVPQTIVCSINTAQTNADGTARFLNGLYSGNNSIRAEVVNATGTVLASATFQPIVLANADVVTAVVTTTKGPVTGPGGFSWRGGDVNVTVRPTIYTGAPNVPTSLTVSLVPSTFAAIQGSAASANADFNAGCGITRTTVAGLGAAPARAGGGCAAAAITKTATTFTTNSATVTFAAASNFAAGGVGNLEDPGVTFAVTGLVASGNNYAGAVAVIFNGVPLTATGGANPLRLDNLAPRFLVLDITPANITALTGNPCAPAASCYLNGAFAFSAANNAALGANIAQTVDYGVDLQTTTFLAGTTAASAVAVANPSTLPETSVSNTNILGGVTVDLLGNTRTMWATDNPACPSVSSTSGSTANQVGTICRIAAAAIQFFGVDLTAPTQTLNGGSFGNNSTDAVANAGVNDATNTVGWTASDAATAPAGPSGVAGVLIKVEQITAAGTVCLNPANNPASTAGFTAAQIACGAAATVLMANGSSIFLPDVAAYYRVSSTPRDLAGNLGTTATRVQLRDYTAPVVGGIQSPSTITGNTDVTFTAFITDNVELGDILPSLNYGAVAEIESVRTTLGTYGFDVFAANGAQTWVMPGFIRSVETTAASVPTGAATLASAVNAYVRDVAGIQLANACAGLVNASNQNCTNRNDPILVNVQAGIGAAAEPTTYGSAGRPFGAGINNGGTFFDVTASASPTAAVAGAATVCSDNPAGAAAGCAVNPASITLFAQARGPALTFANPFSRVVFYLSDPATGRWSQICAGAVSVTDNTTVGTRAWIYSCTFAPTQVAAVGYGIMALGVDASGRALMTSTRATTITSD